MTEPLTPRPDFPVTALPAWARSYAESLAHVLQVDPAVVALSIFGAVAIAVQGKAEVHVRGGWREQLAFWVLLILRSGNRKSPALFKPLGPLLRWEKEENEARGTYRELLQKQLAGFNTKREREAAMGPYKLAEPPRLDMFTSDATLEAIAIGLAEQNETYAIVTDEPTALANVIGGLYSESGNTNTGILMTGYTGSPYRRKRVKSQEAWLERPALSLMLFGQPAIFDQLASESLIELGFVGRLLIARPRDLLGERRVHAEEIPESVQAAYSEKMRKVLAAPLAHALPDIRASWVADPPPPWPRGPLDRHVLELDDDAVQLHLETEKSIEPMLREGEALGDLTDFGGKLSGLVARAAALLHVLQHPGDWWERPVDVDAMARGIEIGRYALGQVLDLYSEGARERKAANVAEYVLTRAREMASNGAAPPIVTKRALARALIQGNGRGRIRSTSDLMDAVETLIDRGQFIPDLTSDRGERWLLSEPDTSNDTPDRPESEEEASS